jgi:hypothetical protein
MCYVKMGEKDFNPIARIDHMYLISGILCR